MSTPDRSFRRVDAARGVGSDRDEDVTGFSPGTSFNIGVSLIQVARTATGGFRGNRSEGSAHPVEMGNWERDEFSLSDPSPPFLATPSP
jgi:hypothetical protein